MNTTTTIDKNNALITAAGVVGLSLIGMATKAWFFPARKSTPQVVLLTGASSGIGKVTALHLIRQGHIVYGAARRVEQMKDIVEAGGHALALDVTQEDSIVAVVQRITAEQGRIDVLINNAGYAVYGAVEDITMDEARRQFQVNIFGLARLTQQVLPHMRQAGTGRIIVTSSMGGKIYTPFGSWYHATKHALEGWSDCLRLEVKPFGIDVVIIEPGLIRTEFADIVAQPMLDRSKGKAYEHLVQKYAQGFESNQGLMSDPSVVAKAMAQAVSLKHPRRRYLIGSMAKPLVFIRSWFGDGVYDAMMMASIQ